MLDWSYPAEYENLTRVRERERGFTPPQLAQGRGSGVIVFKSLVISRKNKDKPK